MTVILNLTTTKLMSKKALNPALIPMTMIKRRRMRRKKILRVRKRRRLPLHLKKTRLRSKYRRSLSLETSLVEIALESISIKSLTLTREMLLIRRNRLIRVCTKVSWISSRIQTTLKMLFRQLAPSIHKSGPPTSRDLIRN